MSIALGPERVRLDFNPGNSGAVSKIKSETASLIDHMENWKSNGEQARCAALAQTKYEEAAMWAVKAITHKG